MVSLLVLLVCTASTIHINGKEQTPAELLKRDDKNHDGKLSHSEFVERGQSLAETVSEAEGFGHADLDGDGFHSEEEIVTELMLDQGFHRENSGQFIEMGVAEAFKAADENKDGVITRAEYEKAWPSEDQKVLREMLALLDTNHDGKTSLEEAKQFQSEHLQEAIMNSRQEARRRIKLADKDGDGKLSPKEKHVLEREKAFEAGDQDGDGYHSKEEIEFEILHHSNYSPVLHSGKLMYHLPTEFLEGFSAADTNRDEKVSLQEFLSFFQEKTEMDFKAEDTNGDGYHSLNEMAKQIFSSKEYKDATAYAKKTAAMHINDADKDGDGLLSKHEFNAHIEL